MGDVLVIGARGVLGSCISNALSRCGNIRVHQGSRSGGPAGWVEIDTASRESLRRAVVGMDVVVVVAPQAEPGVQMACVEAQVPCVDVSPSGKLYGLTLRDCADATVPLVMMTGFFPGLSGILAAHVVRGLDVVHHIDIGLLQSSNARVGATGVADMLRAISRPVAVGDRRVRGFSAAKAFAIGPQSFVGRAVHYDEADILTARLGAGEITYWTAWDGAGLTRFIAAVQRLRLLGPLLRFTRGITPRHDPEQPEVTWLSAEAVGTVSDRQVTHRVGVEAASDYGATATITASVVARLLLGGDIPNGVVIPQDFLDLEGMDGAFGESLRLIR